MKINNREDKLSNTNPVIIRSYIESDEEALLSILELNVPKYFDPIEIQDFKKYLRHWSKSYWTLEYEGKIVGGSGCEIHKKDNSGHIRWIFFHPGYRGKGLGKRAVDHCLKILRDHSGLEKLVVSTSQLAYKFFEKMGYEVIDIKSDYWGEGLDLYHMEMPVD